MGIYATALPSGLVVDCGLSGRLPSSYGVGAVGRPISQIDYCESD